MNIRFWRLQPVIKIQSEQQFQGLAEMPTTLPEQSPDFTGERAKRPIFISYRRDDTEGQAGRLFEDLSDVFGPEMVFMDVAGIQPGIDFRRAIEQQTASCGVLLALIGRNWLTITNADGKRRLDDLNDVVRFETASALRRDIPVIPVLVQGSRMPRPEDLPDDLKELAFRNSVEITHARWDSDVQLLITALQSYVPRTVSTPMEGAVRSQGTSEIRSSAAESSASQRPAHGKSKWGVGVIALLVMIVIGGGWMAYDRRQADPSAQTNQHREGICVQGYIWREATAGDKVCVTPAVHAQTVNENRLIAANREPAGGAYGPNTCRQGFVWREAFPNDFACVVPASRSQAAADNAAASRRVVPLPR